MTVRFEFKINLSGQRERIPQSHARVCAFWCLFVRSFVQFVVKVCTMTTGSRIYVPSII